VSQIYVKIILIIAKNFDIWVGEELRLLTEVLRPLTESYISR